MNISKNLKALSKIIKMIELLDVTDIDYLIERLKEEKNKKLLAEKNKTPAP